MVTILGGGLCGSLLALVLARRNIKVTILERQPDPNTTGVTAGRSINLAMSARGIRALEYAGVFDLIKPLLMPMRGRMIHAIDGSTELQQYGQNDFEVIFSVSRIELNRILLSCAEKAKNVSVRYAQEGVAYYPHEAILRVRDHANDNDYDIGAQPLIAADGAGSIVRRAFAIGDTIGGSEELLPHCYKELAVLPDTHGNFQLDENALHIWPRGDFMLVALPNPGGDFTLTLFMSTGGDRSFSALGNDDKVCKFFDAYFADAAPIIDDLAGSWEKSPIGVLGTVRCKHWHDGGKILLIGDAAHAMVPFHAQGMNLAFDDCVVLDKLIGQAAIDWEAVFSDFESAQLENANAIADLALENYVEMRDTVRDPKYILRRELSFALEGRLPDRFIPRYSMIMFHDEIPYSVARERGIVQQRLLEELTDGIDSIDGIDIDAATRKVQDRLSPLPS